MAPVSASSSAIYASSGARLPRALGAGARVALVAPAGPVTEERIEAAIHLCRSLGLDPVVASSARKRSGYLAGSDADRLRDLQGAFDDPAIDGVWALRGGYGTLRILDYLTLDRQRRDPIPFLGFSDNTTIHLRNRRAGTITFHAPHPGTLHPAATLLSLKRTLFSSDPPGALPTIPGDPQPQLLVPGVEEGELIGGNLALLAALCGSRDALDATGKILFLEDINEPAYRVDRLLTQLLRSGGLAGVRGLAYGRFSCSGPDEGHEVGGVLREFAERLGVPAVGNLPFGHVDHNCTLPIGGIALLDANTGQLTLTEGVVRPV